MRRADEDCPEKQPSININLRAQTNAQLDDFCRQNTIAKKHLISNLLQWFMELEPTAFTAIFGRLTNARERAALARWALERIIAAEKGEMSEVADRGQPNSPPPPSQLVREADAPPGSKPAAQPNQRNSRIKREKPA